jgi:hypothetical protein
MNKRAQLGDLVFAEACSMGSPDVSVGRFS